MLSEAQIKNLLSHNESLQIQLDDANNVIAARDQEIEFLQNQLADTAALRSKMEGQQDEIENFHNLLHKQKKQASGALTREMILQQDLNELATLKNTHHQLLQQYANLTSQLAEAEARVTNLTGQNNKLEQIVAKMGELRSILEISNLEREELKKKIIAVVPQKYLKEINL